MTSTTAETPAEYARKLAEFLGQVPEDIDAGPAMDDDERLYFVINHEYDVTYQAEGGPWMVQAHDPKRCRGCVPCDICGDYTRRTPEEYERRVMPRGMTEIHCDGIPVRVCMVCTGKPVSQIAKTAAEIKAALPAVDDPWAGNYSPF
jgi:hypothetical protein